jgi:hypothetical protein
MGAGRQGWQGRDAVGDAARAQYCLVGATMASSQTAGFGGCCSGAPWTAFIRLEDGLENGNMAQSACALVHAHLLLACRQPLFFNTHKLKIALLDILGALLSPLHC